MKRNTQAGFTYIEAALVSAVMVPVFVSIVGTSSLIGRTIDSSQRSVAVSEAVRNAGQLVAQYVRSGLVSTCQVKASQTDVATAQLAAETLLRSSQTLNGGINALIHYNGKSAWGLASSASAVYIPTVGEWISPPANSPRDNMQFRSADGVLSMNAQAMTPPRALGFVLDESETVNGKDDDGDGLIDQGKLTLQLNSSLIVLADGIEECSFDLTGRIMKVTLQVGRRDKQGTVHRAKLTQSFFMRNN